MRDISNTKYDDKRRDYIKRRIKELEPWYHKIDFGDGIVTPGFDYEQIWDPMYKLIEKIDYKGKKVLDLGSWDGYWAFEAERRGASLVVSTDARIDGYRNLLFAREILESDVVPLCNVPVQDLKNRLSVVGMPEKYDIIHHFGLFYHLRDPLASLSQARHMLNDGGKLILETAFIDDDSNSYMSFSGLSGNHHFYGISDTWAPTKLCLREVLVRSFLNPVQEEDWQYLDPGGVTKQAIKNMLRTFRGDVPVSRISMVAEVLPEDDGHSVDHRKVFGFQ